jgi:hypothetical protein
MTSLVTCSTKKGAGYDLVFAHRLQQRGLHLGRGAIDFIGQDQVVENRPALEFESAFLGAVDLGAGQVGRQQVRGELDAVEIAFDAVGQHLDGGGLGQARRAFHQQVAVTEQGHGQAAHQALLANDQLVDSCFQLGKRGALGVVSRVLLGHWVHRFHSRLL